MFEAGQIRVRAAAFIPHGPQAQEVPCIIGRCGESEACMLQSCCGETGSPRAGSLCAAEEARWQQVAWLGAAERPIRPVQTMPRKPGKACPAPTRGGGYWRGVQNGAFGW